MLLRTTKYYSVLQSTPPVLLRTTKYYSSPTPYYKVLFRTTKYYSVLQSATLYYKVLLQYYSVLQSTTQACKTSISCEASATFQATSFQNEHFVRGFRNFSSNRLPKWSFRTRLPWNFTEEASKRAFRARLLTIFTEEASKTIVSCEASSTFPGTSFQNDRFVWGFLNFSRNKLPERAFRARLLQLFRQRSFQSVAPATQNAKMASHLESLRRQNEHFVRDFLQIPHFQLENRRFRASFSSKAIFTELKKYDFCEASATFLSTNQMLRLPRYLKYSVTFARPCHCDSSKRHLRHVRKCCACNDIAKGHITKCCACHEKNNALALTRFQSIAPVTQNSKMTSHFVTWERQNEHFVRDFLHFSHFEGQDCVAVRVHRPMERN